MCRNEGRFWKGKGGKRIEALGRRPKVSKAMGRERREEEEVTKLSVKRP